MNRLIRCVRCNKWIIPGYHKFTYVKVNKSKHRSYHVGCYYLEWFLSRHEILTQNEITLSKEEYQVIHESPT